MASVVVMAYVVMPLLIVMVTPGIGAFVPSTYTRPLMVAAASEKSRPDTVAAGATTTAL